jgi:hypothetical protein
MALKLWRQFDAQISTSRGLWYFMLHFGILRLGIGYALGSELLYNPLAHGTVPFTQPLDSVVKGWIFGLLSGVFYFYFFKPKGAHRV